ncbi:MAG: enoyl-CoA hydratase/isomerase family protein [Dehalococcoidales bacterium]|nr:MAG: enoyl-CoA hydratase/isomerase family protein [Dehalococcoidales bacterium]
MGEATIYEKKDHIAVLTMNRPEARNAMNAAMRKEMGEALVDFRDDNDSWVLILTGAGDKAFSAGMDLKEMAANLAGGGSGVRSEGITPSLMAGNIEIWKPIIAAINGVAVGGGLETALACDIRIAAAGVQMGLSEPKRGIIPGGGGMARLPRLVNLGAALEIMMTGDLIPAEEAYRIGLVNHVIPGAELMDAAYDMARRLTEVAPLAVQAIKETVRKNIDMSLEDALPARFGPNVMASEDAREGTAAFGEKRPPVWKGR